MSSDLTKYMSHDEEIRLLRRIEKLQKQIKIAKVALECCASDNCLRSDYTHTAMKALKEIEVLSNE